MVEISAKTKIFLAAFWSWTWILFQLSNLSNKILKFVIYWLPNNVTPTFENLVVNKKPIKLLEARDGFGKIITNKLKLFMNLKWDKTMCDDKGGVDLDMFCKYIGSSVIWVIYLMEYEVNPIYHKFITDVQTDQFNMNAMHKFIKTAVIDISNKIIKKFDSINDNNTNCSTDSILFGEINFI
jgi:hypothetical protein